MSTKIFRDDAANAIFVEDANGVQFLNSLQAFRLDPLDVVLSIKDLARDIQLFADIPFAEFIDESGGAYGSNAEEVTNALNALFSTSGTSTDSVPVITSSLSLGLSQGQTLNYELTANFGVAYEWNDLPAGVVTVEGNVRKLIGGSNLLVGTYTPTMTAVNYNGEDTETLTITVTGSPYSNTYSIVFRNQDYMDAPPAVANPLYRPTNGAGSSDAWTITGRFKAGSNNSNEQTLLMFGGSSQANEGRVHLFFRGDDDHITLVYGSNNNNLTFKTPNGTFPHSVWKHWMVSYDGGGTGSDQASLSDYYGRFEIWVDGTSQTLELSHNNYGYSGSVLAEYFRVGRNGSTGNYCRNCAQDELAMWDSDQTANAAAIYNSGTAHDLAQLASPPVHYWRMGDGDTYPTIVDNVGSLDFTMVNMTSSDIVSDT